MKTKPRTFPSSQRGDFSHDRAKERKVLRRESLSNRTMKRFAFLFALFPLISQAADLTITVTGIRNANVKIAALVFTNDQG